MSHDRFLLRLRWLALFLAVWAILLLAAQTASADCVPGNQVDKPAFFTEVARQLRNPSVPEEAMDFAVSAFLAWEPYENTAACWNPLATTLRYSGKCQSWNLPGNSAGVQQYPSQECGIRATADTLNYTFNGEGRAYQAIRRMMARQGFDEAALIEELRRWVGRKSYAKAVVSRWRELYYASGGETPTATGLSAQPTSPLFFDIILPGETAHLRIEVRNTGQTTWELAQGIELRRVWKDVVSPIVESYPLPHAVPAGDTVSWEIAVNTGGERFTRFYFQMYQGSNPFGPEIGAIVITLPEQLKSLEEQIRQSIQRQIEEWQQQAGQELERRLEQLEQQLLTWLQRELERQAENLIDRLCGTTALLPGGILALWCARRRVLFRPPNTGRAGHARGRQRRSASHAPPRVEGSSPSPPAPGPQSPARDGGRSGRRGR